MREAATLGVRTPAGEPGLRPAPHPGSGEPALWYEPFDPAYCRGVMERTLVPIIEHYFRAQVFGAHKIPGGGPVVLAANHSGNAFPHDAIALDALLWQRDGMNPAAKLRAVFEKELTLAWWMRPFGIDNFWRRAGGVDMTFDNFDRLLARGDRVLYFPEGVAGIGKGFNRRYQLQRFSTSFVLLAARHRAPVLPLYIINAEFINPFSYTFRPLDRLMQRLFHVPFLPLPSGIVAALWPWVWYLAFPARLIFVVGDPIDVAALTDREGIDLDRPERTGLNHVAMKIRHRMQEELDEYVALHGRRPWDLRGLLREFRRARGRRARVLPTGWPLAFLKEERDLHRPPARHRLHAILRDLDLVCYYLPLVGWPLLTLARRLRRPPYGHRGLGRRRRDAHEGNFVWRLCDRPLPPRDADGALRPPGGPPMAAR